MWHAAAPTIEKDTLIVMHFNFYSQDQCSLSCSIPVPNTPALQASVQASEAYTHPYTLSVDR
jgi:hypothetical protein